MPCHAKQLLLIIEDADVPLPFPLIHTIALINSQLTGLDEGGLAKGTTRVAFIPASFGRTGYAGPRPIAGHGVHRFGFYMFALDKVFDLTTPPTSFKNFLSLLTGHVIARGRLIGIYERD
jgi:phosphatidylethanolamine-binding protein (PEBP) family uncharacterized protein